MVLVINGGCFISWFYIKPQQTNDTCSNGICCFISWFYIKPQPASVVGENGGVVSYLDSTSNHNDKLLEVTQRALFHILILHQTTTVYSSRKSCPLLFHILILHQTTTTQPITLRPMCCFISWFYIKPQHITHRTFRALVVSYLDSTSNHNLFPVNPVTGNVVSYLDSTSNHNNTAYYVASYVLFHILILHQTTTWFAWNPFEGLLFHILILHQTTTCTI